MNQEKKRFFIAGGTLPHDALSYVKREADLQLQEFTAAGELCYVLTTRQMGKSSLMVRTEAYLREHNIQTASIDLTSIGTAQIDEWFLGVLDDLQSQLSLVTDAEEWWEENRSLSQIKRFTKYVQEVIPKEVDGQVAIFIDEIDAMLNLDFADDFFAAIRAIHNRRASLPENQCVSFILLGVAAPNDLIKNQTKTPFNVGQRISLKELSLEEAQVLLKGLPGESRAILERIFYWTKGHPYLTQKIGLAIAREGEREWTDLAIDDLVERLFLTDEASTKESNLQFVRGRVTSSPNKKNLLLLYRKVYDGTQIRSNEQSIFQNELKLYGLLRTGDQKYLEVRNRIYRRVFNQEWIQENKPANRWPLFAAGFAALAILAIFAAIFFQRQTQQALEPAEVLAQSYIDGFESTTNPILRLNNLANLFALESYDDDALLLFDSLTVDEQVALFEEGGASTTTNALTPTAMSGGAVTSSASDSFTLLPQMRGVIQGTYTTLYVVDLRQPQDSTRLLGVMAEVLEQADDADSQALRDEIDTWLKGRDYASEGNYDAANTAYDIVIGFNDENPATRFERALIFALLNDYGAAVADLTSVWETWPDRRDPIIQEVSNNDGLIEYLLSMEDPPPYIGFVPEPTPTSTSTPLPTATLQPEDTLTPTELSSPTLVPQSPTPTILPTLDPNPEIMVLGESVKEKPIEAIRFGNGENVIVFVGGLQGGYSPGTVDVANLAIQYFDENLGVIPDTVTLYIVANVNPDAPDDPGNLPGRLNANRVDLNRNWDCLWKEDPRIAGEIVEGGGGLNPFSEPETEALSKFFLKFEPKAVVFWFARAASGVVVAGGCRLDPQISNELGEVYSEKSRYQLRREEELEPVPGDATNWLTDQGIPAIAVILPEYERTDWTNNLNGMLAVLESYK